MVLVNKAKELIADVFTYWKAPAKGDYVAYKEYVMLSVGWLGMRLATVFGIGFGVNNHFTAMTLHMTHKDLLLFGYICTAIGYALAPLNAYIIDNLRSRAGKYKVYIRLAIPAGILSLFALFYPYEKLSYWPMVISLFLIGQIQGYVQGWYNTGVSNLVYVISPNSKERVRIMMVSSLVHNFAPTLSGLLIPLLSDAFANGDLYNVRTYRMVYPAFIVIGVAMSMAAYFGVNERIVQPRSQVSSVGLLEALKAVSGNRLFWIKCTDSWNNFMEDSKNILMQWLFYYGKVGSMTMYGIMDTVSYNSSMWAMLFSPWMIDRMGKRGFKLVKNISQIFITIGLMLTYKKNVLLIGIFYFLNRFWETTEVVDRAIESDIRDYQQYLSGKRIDGAFGVVESYVGGAIGAVTNLFVPWVYKKNGFDGTDYSVLEVYREDGTKNPNSVLYKLLDNILRVALIGAAVDVFPWIFYNLSDSKQRAVAKIIRIRSAVEDKHDGVVTDELFCEACESIADAQEHYGKEKPQAVKNRFSKAYKEFAQINDEIEAAEFIFDELNRYNTAFGEKLLGFCKALAGYGEEDFFNHKDELLPLVLALPEGKTKEEKLWRNEAISNAKSLEKSKASVLKFYKDGIKKFSIEEFDAVMDMPSETKEQRKEKSLLVRRAKAERNAYGKTMEPYLFARRNIILADGYENLDRFIDGYEEISKRLDEKREAERIEEEKASARRKAEAKMRFKK